MSTHSDAAASASGLDPTPAPVFLGRFSDGRTAVAHEVQVRITTRGLVIAAPSLEAERLWAYVDLRAAQPLTTSSHDVLLSSTTEDGATLFVAERTFAQLLAQRAPALTAHRQRLRHAAPWLAAAAGVGAIAGAVWLLDLSPARTMAGLMPSSLRASLGQQVVQSMTKGRRACEAPEGRAALDRLSARLSAATPGGQKFKIVVVDWGLLNAFAAPGSQIVVTNGILTKTESADEVAGVIAHEMGHGIELHPETAIVRGLGMSAAADLFFGGGTFANIGLLLAQLSYSRGAEQEADQHALRILKSAKISNRGLAAFFKRVMVIEGDRGAKSDPKGFKAFDMLRTHPATAERVRRVESQPPYETAPALSPEDWASLRAICGTPPTVPTEKPTPPKKQPVIEPPKPVEERKI